MADVTYDDVADYFIAWSNVTGDLITNLKLQKLVYYAQAWHLAIFHSPLFEANFEAWLHGPVIPDLYFKYREHRWHPLVRDDLDEKSLTVLNEKFGEPVSDFLADILDEYFGLSAYQLEKLTHSEDPWRRARVGIPDDEPSNELILNEWMEEFYSQHVKETESTYHG